METEIKCGAQSDAPVRVQRMVQRMVRRWVVVIIAILAWGTGHWMGYWYGRTKELYESGKRYGAVASDVTWEQWLKRK